MNRCFNRFFYEQYEEEYCTGVFSDELDKMGMKHQVLLNWKMNNTQLRLFGKVRTIVLKTMDTNDEKIAKGLGFLSSLDEGDVLVVKGSNEYAYFGELMTRLSERNKLSGTVIDGLTRDTYYTQKTRYPIFAKGYSPIDIKGRGRVEDTDVPISINGIELKPNDYIFGDNDAVVVIPAGAIKSLAERINEAVKSEENTKKLIQDGASVRDILLHVKEF